MWQVGLEPLVGHSLSVEDIQWSPTEPSVSTACSKKRHKHSLSLRCWPPVLWTRQCGSGTAGPSLRRPACLPLTPTPLMSM